MKIIQLKCLTLIEWTEGDQPAPPPAPSPAWPRLSQCAGGEVRPSAGGDSEAG